MPRKPATTCRVCGAPRDPESKKVLCVPCRRRDSADQMRKRRGIPLDRPYVVRVHPPGTCVTCGGEVHRQGRCREHFNEYHREHRRKLGMRPMEEYNAERAAKSKTPQERRESERQSQLRKQELYRQRAKEGVRPCQTPKCEGKIDTPYGVRCSACRFAAQSTKVVQPKKPKPRHKQQSVKFAPRPRVVEPQPEIIIGPAAFERVRPVDVTGRRVTVLPPGHGWNR